jgi:hypothetical protein
MTTQANRRLPAFRSLFDLHVPNRLDRNVGASVSARVVPNAVSLDFHGFWTGKTAELSGILIFRKKVTEEPHALPNRPALDTGINGVDTPDDLVSGYARQNQARELPFDGS